MLTLDFINVGYGDAILVRDTVTPFTMLVDCGDVAVGDGGPGSMRISAADFLRREGVKVLDLLVLTHLHRDHSGGLLQVLSVADVKEFWTNYLPPETDWGTQVNVPPQFSAGARCLLQSMNIYLSALEHMRTQGTRIHQQTASNVEKALTERLSVEVFLEEDALHRRQFRIWQNVLQNRLYEQELLELDQFINNTSIRLRLSCGGRSMELPGDVYAACWEKHRLSSCDLVKLPHHGHRDSMTPHLLEMLRPACVVISVSNSRTDDCPSAAVLELLLQQGCSVFATDAVHCSGLKEPTHRAVRFSIDESGQIRQEYVD